MAMSRTRKTVLIITSIVVALVLVAIIGLAILIAALRQGEPSIADNSVLSLRVDPEAITPRTLPCTRSTTAMPKPMFM